MSVRVVLTVAGADLPGAVETVLFALREVLGETDASVWLEGIEAGQP